MFHEINLIKKMANAKNSKLIKIYGVTLAMDGQVRPYGNGVTKNKDGVRIAYVDYFIEDLIVCIKEAGLEKEIIKNLK